MKYVMLLIVISMNAYGSDIDNPKYIQAVIKKLQPALNHKEVVTLQRALLKVVGSKDCHISWPVLLSIAYNESSLLRYAVGSNNRSTDLGLMQISERTARLYGYDTLKLMTEEGYNINAGCRVLSDIKDGFQKRVPYWIGLYRSGNRLTSPYVVKGAKSYYHIISRTVNRIMNVYASSRGNQ